MIDQRLYAARKRKQWRFRAGAWLAAGAGLFWLALILFDLAVTGIQGFSPALFTEATPPPPGNGGGLGNAIIGSLMMTTLAVIIGAPAGILAGTWLAEYGRNGRFAEIIRALNDILLSAPSIIIGLFIYQFIVAPMKQFSGIAGALALAMIVLPIVARQTESMLRLLPNSLREAAHALGAPTALSVRFILWRASRAGIVTGVLLAVARISGETAPLLFTALNNQFWSFDMTAPMASLPVVIFQMAMSPYEGWRALAWAGALLITGAVLALSIIARAISSGDKSS